MALRDLFIGVTALLSVMGLGGVTALVVACIWLGPVAVMAVVQPIFAKFISCKSCIVVTAAVLATVLAFWIGRHDAESQCMADKRNSAIAAQKADQVAERHAASDEADRVSVIEKVARDQHESDLAEIERLKNRPSDTCAFDDGDAGGVHNPPGPVGAKPASRAKAPDKSAGRPASRRQLLFPLVWRHWLQGKGHPSDAATDGK